MTQLPLMGCLALAWFCVASAILSLAVAVADAGRHARAPHEGGREKPPLPSGAALLLRALPSLAAAVFVMAVFVPAFLVHEPADGQEAVGWVLLGMAAAALALGGAGMRRGLAASRRARAIVDAWMATARPIQLDELSGTGISACVIEDPFPVVALVGIRRPRLFIARQVVEALTPGELRVTVAHEVAHCRAWDNAKRALLCWSPDLLAWSPSGRRLEREWAAAAECAADRRAASECPVRRLALAAALLKVSRLAVVSAPGARLFSTLHERGDVTARVTRLVTPAPAGLGGPSRWRLSATAAVAGAAAVLLPRIWPAVHAVTEACLRLLP